MKESIVAVATSLFLFSCSGAQQEADTTPTSTPAVEGQTAQVTNANAGITHAYAGPNLMGFVVRNAESLSVTPLQSENFSQWRAEHGPMVTKKVKAITVLEADIKTLSTSQGTLEAIMAKAEQVATIRSEIATIKAGCQRNLKETLDPEQWGKLVVIYKSEAPFLERTGMDALTHVSPLPNYMGVIKGGLLELTEAQAESFRAWAVESQPKVAKLVDEVIALEKTVYNDALSAQPLESILATMAAIEAARVQIITTKNLCRDNAIEQLDETQWKTVVSSI